MKMIAVILAFAGAVAATKMYACLRLHLNNGEDIGIFELTQLNPADSINMNGTIKGLRNGTYVLEVHEKNQSMIDCNSLGPIQSLTRYIDIAELAFMSIGWQEYTPISAHLDSATLVPNRYTSIINHPIGICRAPNSEGNKKRRRGRSVACGYVSPGRCEVPIQGSF